MSKKLKILYLISFFLAAQGAITAYVNSTYLSSFIPPTLIGLVYSLGALISMIGLIEIPKLLAKIGNYRAYLLTASGIMISLFGISAINSKFILLPFVIYMALSYMIYSCLDIFIENFSSDEKTGKIRGLYLTFINLGWVFAPLLSSLLIVKFGYSGIYMAALALFLPILLIVMANFKDFKDPAYRKISLKENLKIMSENKNISRVYLMNFLLQVFYVGMIIYTPIYLFTYLHFTWTTIGLIFMPMLASFVILQFPLGRLADRIGEKEMLYTGFLIMALSTISLLFLPPNALIWALGLLLTRIGAATVEVMIEVYFFKQVKVEDSRTISFFRSAGPVSYIIAPILMTVFLYFFPFQYIFPAIGLLMFLGLSLAYQIKDTD